MKTILRWSAAFLGVAFFCLPARAQYLGLHPALFGGPVFGGPYVSPYYAPYGYRAPLRIAPFSRSRLPIINLRSSSEPVTTLRTPAPSAATPRASEIRVSVDGAGGNNAAIAEAIAANKTKVLEPQTELPEGALRAKVNEPLKLAVGLDPKVPPTKPDLSDVVAKDHVVWTYPPKSEFQVIHEDSSKALLVLVPKAAGTYRVLAIVVEPLQVKQAEPGPKFPPPPPKSDDAKEKKKKTDAKTDEPKKVEEIAKPLVTTKAVPVFRGIVTFVIYVEGSTTPPVGPVVIPGKVANTPTEAFAQIKAAFAAEKSQSEMGELKNKLGLIDQEKIARFALLEGVIAQSKRTSQIPNTVAAIEQFLKITQSSSSLSSDDVRALAKEILKGLQ